MKSCRKCNISKELGDFGINRAIRDGRKTTCRACEKQAYANWAAKNPGIQRDRTNKWKKKNELRYRELGRAWKARNPDKVKKARNAWRKKNPGKVRVEKFNISIETFNAMFAAQQGCCAICSRHQSEFKKSLHIDHDHSTDGVRGLLCGPCNTALGSFRDDVSLLHKAIVYLQRSKITLVREG